MNEISNINFTPKNHFMLTIYQFPTLSSSSIPFELCFWSFMEINIISFSISHLELDNIAHMYSTTKCSQHGENNKS